METVFFFHGFLESSKANDSIKIKDGIFIVLQFICRHNIFLI